MQIANLLLPVVHEVGCVISRLFPRPVGVVPFLIGEAQTLTRNFVVFDADVLTLAIGHDVGLDVLIFCVPAQVTVELAIFWGARITHLGRPHLLRRIHDPVRKAATPVSVKIGA